MSAVFFCNYDSLLPFVVLTHVAHFHSSVYYLLVFKFTIEFPCSPNDWSDCVKTFEKTKMLKLDKVYLFKEQSIIRHFIKDKTKILPPPPKKMRIFYLGLSFTKIYMEMMINHWYIYQLILFRSWFDHYYKAIDGIGKN